MLKLHYALPFLMILSGCAAGRQLEVAADDPHIWLEEVQGQRALAQVEAWNAASARVLEAEPGFATYRERALELLEDDERIAHPDRIIGDQVLNLWQDAANPRGIWRITALDAFAAGRPQWRTLIDLDALGLEEGKSWVWHGADCLAPEYRRCMVALSDGGTDADTVREFDLQASAFVPNGFVLPEGKNNVAWAGPDALYIGRDWGAGSLTSSGYPRTVRLWRRGTPLASAQEIAAGEASDVSIGVARIEDGDTPRFTLNRATSFYTSQVSHIADDGRIIASPLPEDAEIQDVLDGRVIALINKDFNAFPAGSLVAYSIEDVLAGRPAQFEQVFVPTQSEALEEVSAGASLLWVKLLDDVSGRLVTLRRNGPGEWQQQRIALPDNATVHLDAAAGRRDLAFATVEGMLTPPALYAVEPGAEPRSIQTLPARFDASNMRVEQRFATSKDGTKVPYFLVVRKDVTGPVPALIHAYGGFRAAQTPTYLVDQPYRGGPAGLFWVEEGNAFVLANLRGGGEYGPRWHDAALREKRQNAFDDLHAVAEDLIATGISAPKQIGVSGRSNGGLLVGVAMTQRPDLYGGVVMGSPLLDMKRYSHLLAGASWMGEYGDPDVPADWAFIREYSPYQKLREGQDYPVPFIYTSTLDDRVHPGHARKFAARLEQMGYPFYYDEATEGGHAAGADHQADAERAAMITAYLNRVLAGGNR